MYIIDYSKSSSMSDDEEQEVHVDESEVRTLVKGEVHVHVRELEGNTEEGKDIDERAEVVVDEGVENDGKKISSRNDGEEGGKGAIVNIDLNVEGVEGDVGKSISSRKEGEEGEILREDEGGKDEIVDVHLDVEEVEGDVGKSISSRKEGEEGEILREDGLETEGVVEDKTSKVDLHVGEVEGDGETEWCSNSAHSLAREFSGSGPNCNPLSTDVAPSRASSTAL